MAQLSHMPRTRWVDALIIVLTLVALAFMSQMLWGLLSQFSDVILLFGLAALVAFALNPLIKHIDNQPLPSGMVKLARRHFGNKFARYLERFRFTRLVAVAVLYVTLALILIGVIAVLIPPVVQQLRQMIDEFPDFAKRASDMTQTCAADIAYAPASTRYLGALGSFQNLATLALQNAFVILGGAVTLVGNLLLVLLLSFFFALDGPRLFRTLFNLVPEEYDDGVRMLADTVDRTFGGFIRATLLQAFLVGAGTAIVMGIFGEPFLLGASLFAGFFMLIPFVGTALALVPPVLATLSHDTAQAPVIFIILLVYQLLVSNVVMPKLLSDALGLHPLIIMASLLVGVKIGGAWGLSLQSRLPASWRPWHCFSTDAGRALMLQSRMVDDLSVSDGSHDVFKGEANMRSGFKIGKIFGIDISIDWSVIFLLLLITWNLAAGVFPQLHPNWGPTLNWGTALVAALLFVASILAHELSHSLVARARGLPVSNITLFIFGGVSNIAREPPTPSTEFLMAIVGPLTSILLGIVFVLLGGIGFVGPFRGLGNPTRLLAQMNPAQTILLYLGPVNILLGVFNLIPGFPLDGGRVLRSILWTITKNLRLATRWASWVGQGVAWLFIIAGIAMVFGVDLPFFGTGFISGLWLAFIGWFLNNAAMQSYQQVVVHDLLEGVPVSQLMRSNVPSVTPNTSVASLVHDHIMGTDERSFPVIDQTGLVGLICIEDVRKVHREEWNATPVSRIMTPVNQLVTATPREDAGEALDALARKDVEQLPVMQNGQLVGMLRRRDIVRWLQLQSERVGRQRLLPS